MYYVYTYSVPRLSEFVEGLDVEPGTLVPLYVQRDPHGILLQEGRQSLVHCQVLVALKMQ